MPYTPDATDATEPTDDKPAGSAADEFQALKLRVNQLESSIQTLIGLQLSRVLRVPSNETVPELPNAIFRANKSLEFDSSGSPIVVVPAGGGGGGNLAALLADGSNASNGSSLVAWNPSLLYAANSVGSKLNELTTPKDLGSDLTNFALGPESLRKLSPSATANTAFGYQSQIETTTGIGNTSYGYRTLTANLTGNYNTAIGCNNLNSNVGLGYNTAVGYGCAFKLDTGYSNTVYGFEAMHESRGSSANTVYGYGAGHEGTNYTNSSFFGLEAGYFNNTSGNAAFGHQALKANINGTGQAAFGFRALNSSIGNNNSAFGYNAAVNNTSGERNSAFGFNALYTNTSGIDNTAFGNEALENASGNHNTGFGSYAAWQVTTGSGNTAFGKEALAGVTTGQNNLGLGFESGKYQIGTAILANYSNTSCVGANTGVSGNNQVQLGDATTNTYVYGSVQTRSDIRDKIDSKPTELGLEFITNLGKIAIDYRYNYRELYLDTIEVEVPIEVDSLVLDEQGNPYKIASTVTQKQKTSVPNDGSRKRVRFHHGFDAAKVNQIALELGVSFGGYQDHTVNGGADIKSLAYEEFIAPLARAIYELNLKIDSK